MRLNWEGETCKLCTREQRLAWLVSDKIWGSVVIHWYKEQVLCLECFLRMADDRRINVKVEDIIISGVVGSKGG